MLSNLSIKTKLYLASVSMLVFLVLLGGANVFYMNGINRGYSIDVLNKVNEAKEAQKLYQHLLLARNFIERFLNSGQMVETDNAIDHIRKADHIVKSIEATTESDEVKEILKKITVESTKFTAGVSKIIAQEKIRGLNENLGLRGKARKLAHELEGLNYMTDAWKIHYLTIRRHEKDFIERESSKYINRLSNVVETFLKEVGNSQLSQARKKKLTGLLKDYEFQFVKLTQITNKISELKTKVKLHSEVVQVFAEELLKIDDQLTQEEVSYISGKAEQSVRISWIVVGVTILVAGFFAFFLSRSILNPIKEAADFANLLAARDLTNQLEVKSNDEVGTFIKAINIATTSLRTTLQNIAKNSQALSTASTELSVTTKEVEATSGEISESIEASAQALTETNANLQEQVDSIQSITKSVNQAQSMADQAVVNAQKGTDAIITTKETMEKITDSSKRIESIMGAISGIANQTNLLSLNAAIEAAKAGDAGKGFAVVAEEVRSLAEQSSESAVQTRKLIDISTQNVSEGSKVITDTEKALAIIIENVSDISTHISDVTTNVKDQEGRTREMAAASDELHSQIENNAAAVNQLASTIQQVDQTAADLSLMADEQANEVARFKIEDNQDWVSDQEVVDQQPLLEEHPDQEEA